MKVVVINISGNTGKTSLTKHMFVPLLNPKKRISIEDTNSEDGRTDVKIGAKKFKDLAAELNVANPDDNYVIDVGSSNAKEMFEKFDQFSMTTDMVDVWIVPSNPPGKQVIDSLTTAENLKNMGISTKKIAIIPNIITDPDMFESDFAPLFLARDFGITVPNSGVRFTEAFALLQGDERSVFDIVNNKPDFEAKKAAARKSENMESELYAIGQEMVLYDLCRGAAKNIQSVFNELPQFKHLVKKGQKNG